MSKSETTYVFAFDRNGTVSVSPQSADAAVPIEWVRQLAAESAFAVYAIGGQQLTEEADIPGVAELVEQHPTAEIHVEDDGTLLGGYHPTRRERLGILADLYPDANRLVIDDAELSDVAGWRYFHPQRFVTAIEQETVTFASCIDN